MISDKINVVKAIYEALGKETIRLANYRPFDLEYIRQAPCVCRLKFADHSNHEFYVEAEELGDTFLTKIYIRDRNRNPEYYEGSVKDIPIGEE